MTYQKVLYQYLKSLLMMFFSKVINTINSENTLNADLKSLSNWAYQWNTEFHFLSETKYSFLLLKQYL